MWERERGRKPVAAIMWFCVEFNLENHSFNQNSSFIRFVVSLLNVCMLWLLMWWIKAIWTSLSSPNILFVLFIYSSILVYSKSFHSHFVSISGENDAINYLPFSNTRQKLFVICDSIEESSVLLVAEIQFTRVMSRTQTQSHLIFSCIRQIYHERLVKEN